MQPSLLQVNRLKKYFLIRRGLSLRSNLSEDNYLKAVDGLDFEIHEGETFALVGESGCGKSTTARMIAGLEIPTSGKIFFEGRDISKIQYRDLKMRRNIQMVFQEVSASLNPRKTIRQIMRLPIEVHKIVTGSEKDKFAESLLDKVGLVPANKIMDRYPHELSGGQQQRVGIARALTMSPKIIIADEPVSALDATIRSQIIKLMLDLKKELNLTFVLITHDLSIANEIADTVSVMYLGRIVEMASASNFFASPKHPYSKALISAIPVPDPNYHREHIELFEKTSPLTRPVGCSFHPRCPFSFERCTVEDPILKKTGDSTGYVACHLYA